MHLRISIKIFPKIYDEINAPKIMILSVKNVKDRILEDI
jgi:hypothetical protein